MFNQLTYNVVIQRLKAFATGHFLINDFTHGTLANMVEQINESSYPLMHVTPNEVSYNVGERSFTLDIVFADLPRLIDDRENYEKEVVSDMIQLAEDLIAEIRNGSIIFGSDVTLGDGVRLTPFTGDFTHTIAGVQMSVTLTFPYNWNACDIPADWTTGGSGSGSPAPNVSTLVLKTNGTANVVQSILDLTDGANITINDLGDGRVEINSTGGTASWGNIIGTLSNQIDLQNALDTKVEFVALQMPSPTNAAFQVSGSPVINDGGTLIVTANGTANDYIDGTGALQSFPAIPESIDDLNDVNTSTAVADDLLTFDATNWVPITPKDFAAKLELDNLGNVDEITPSNGDVLRYNNASTWINDSGLTTAENNIAQLQSDIANAVLDGDAAGGDLSGTFPNPSVDKVHGVDFQSGNPTDGDTWVYSNTNSKWQHQMLHASQVDNDSAVTGQHVDDALDHLNSTKEATINAGTASQYWRGDKTWQTHDIASITDATDVGKNIVKVANPSAIRYLRINADNSISTITAATLLNDLGIGNITGSGILTLANDVSLGTGVLNTNFVDVTGLSFPITAGRKYSFRGTFIITQSGVATGIRLSINANVAVNVVQYYTQVSLNQNSSSVWYGNAFNSGAPTTAPQNFYSNTIGMMNGYIDANNTGTAIFRFSKWAGNAGTTTIKAGSFVEYTIF